jgi:hypothetical protein
MRPLLARSAAYLPGALLGLAWWAYMFAGFRYFERFDWQQHLSFREIQRRIVVDYHQFPLWNPWLCGGEPLAGHPHFDFPYPSTLLAGLLGTFYGTLSLVLLSVVVFLWGAERLVRHLGVRDSWLAWAIASEGVHIFVIYVWGGALEYLTVAWVPWFWLFFFRSTESSEDPGSALRAVLLGAGALALVAIGSAPYIGAGTVVLLLIVAALEAVRRSALLPLLRVLQIGAVTAGLTALKWVPMASLLGRVRRMTTSNTDAHLVQPANVDPFLRSLRDLFFTGGPVRVDAELLQKLGIYMITYQFSAAMLVLALAGVCVAWRRSWPLAVATGCCLLVLPADASVINVWRLLHGVFPFSDLEFPIKFVGLLVLQLIMLAALGGARLETYLRDTQRVRLLALAIGVTSAFYVVDRSAAVRAQFAQAEEPSQLMNAPFAQVRGDSREQYENVLRNRGTLNCYDSLGSRIDTTAAGSDDAAEYRGEAYWADGDTVVYSVTTPNEIRLSSAGQTGKLIVNQNYFPGWRARGSDGQPLEVIEEGRLLAVNVLAPVQWVTLRFKPTSVLVGWSLSLGSVLVSGLLWRRTKRAATAPR